MCFHANANGLKKKKYDRTTMAIRNAGESTDMKVITLNKLITKRKVKCLEIPNDVVTEINTLQKEARKILNISDDMSSKDIVTKITEYTRKCINDKLEITENRKYAIGALLGCQYVSAFGWTWQSVDWSDDPNDGAIGILNSDKSMFNNPIGWVCKTIEESRPVTFLLSYNMIEAGKYPKLEPNSARAFY